VLSVRPPAGYAHAIIATRLMGWLLAAGIPADHIAQTVGLRIPGKTGGMGGRIPDLVVWSKPQSDGVWLPVADVLLVIEVISPGSEATDTVAKRAEYAGAGIPQYWTVDQDPAQTVTMYQLDSPGRSTPPRSNMTFTDRPFGDLGPSALRAPTGGVQRGFACCVAHPSWDSSAEPH